MDNAEAGGTEAILPGIADGSLALAATGYQLKNFTMRRIEVTRASMSAGVLYT
jgi:hypothetical protein